MTNSRLQGLPTEDFDEERLVAFMSKCGVVAQDDKGVPKVKLYRGNDTGDLKGDGAWPVPWYAPCCVLVVSLLCPVSLSCVTAWLPTST